MFAGLALGSRLGMLSQMFYLISGFAGAPVFAGGGGGAAWLFNPHGTGGYLLAFPLAAWLIGRISEKYGQKSILISFLACLAGIALIHILGCGWLSFYGHLKPITALLMGSAAFIFWDIAKAFVVIGLLNMKKQMKNI
jgi:biotin transport system substrate-specific component